MHAGWRALLEQLASPGSMGPMQYFSTSPSVVPSMREAEEIWPEYCSIAAIPGRHISLSGP